MGWKVAIQFSVIHDFGLSKRLTNAFRLQEKLVPLN
jgi:hypothetical protein